MVVTKTVLLFITFSLTFETKVITEWTHNITVYNGDVITFSFPRMDAAQCLYSERDDRLFCMRNFEYNLVVPEWRYRSDDIQYVSINCRKQDYFFHHKSVCICKTGSQAKDPTKYRQHDGYSFCQLEHVGSDTFENFSNLKLLDMGSNRVTTIDKVAFRGLDRLELLSLSDNPFDYLPDRLMCPLPLVTYVYMRQTQLVTFPSNTFSCGRANNSIEHLDLSSGTLREIGPYSLKHLQNLISLNLSYNLIESMDENSLSGAASLRFLDLSGNHLEQFVSVCEQSPELEHLLLRDNSLVAFNFSSLRECSMLKRLDLALNNIIHLQGHLSGIQTIEVLLLSHNRLQKLGFHETFGNSSFLERLDISYNGLTVLHRDLLHGLSNLTFLNLSGNSLRENVVELDRILAYPGKLRALDLSFNQVSKLSNGTFKNLEELELLNLSFNRLEMLQGSWFEGLSRLRSLVIKFNTISFIEAGTFDDVDHLELLDLSNNQIRSIGMLPDTLHSLVLDENLLTAFPVEFSLPEMTYLSVRRNSIRKIQSEAFVNASGLVELDISENSLAVIKSGAFWGLNKLSDLKINHNELMLNLSIDTFAGANNLQKLTLSGNRISSIDRFLDFPSMCNLREIDISFNPLTRVEELIGSTNCSQLEEMNISGCLIDTVSAKAFENLKKLKNVYLENNNLQGITPIYAAFGTRFHLSKNPMICSCDMKWLKDHYVTVNSRKLPTSNYLIDTCAVYPKLKENPFLDTRKSMFLCKQSNNCDDRCDCYSQDIDLPVSTVVCVSIDTLPYNISQSSESLYLDGNNYRSFGAINRISNKANMTTMELFLNHSLITSLDKDAFVDFPQLKVLNLGNNLLTELPVDIFRNQLYLERLSLNDNQFTVINSSIIEHLKTIKFLDISGNQFLSLSIDFTSALTELHSLIWISLGRNPWTCDCDNVFLRVWMESHYSKVFDKRAVTCGKSELTDMFIEEYECAVSASRMSTTKIVSISALVIIVVLSLLVGFVMYFRRDIVALMYAKFSLRCCRKKFDTDKPYDVLIVYDATNERCSTWFSETLLPKLEKQQYKVQFVDDSSQNSSVWDNQNALIESSSCTLLIVTEYIDSNEQCMRYFKAALEHQKRNPRHSIIIAIFGDIDMNKLDVDIMVKLRKGNYLTARSRVFWSRLVYELPDPCPDVATRVRTEYDNISESEVTLYCSPSSLPQTGHL